jgi:tRNA threonylcarbamoyladenosine modification (KEOPS) complex  Pcc1 subunit
MLMAIMAKAVVRLKFSSDKQLKTLLDALKPETKTLSTRRANVKLDIDGHFLLLTIDAEDTVALRSTLNAYLRWINSTINVIATVEHATLN